VHPGVVQLTASAATDLELVRASMLLESDPAAAARRACDILDSSPGHEEASLLLAAACRRLGDPATAAQLLENLARAHPASPVMQLELGRAYAAGGRGPAALAAFGRAVELDAGLADGWRELATQWFLAGNTLAGDAAYANYSRLVPIQPELHEASDALAGGRLDAAESVLSARLRRVPGDVEALRLVAGVAARRGDRATAERVLNDCLEHAPGFSLARYDLARLLSVQQRIGEALPHVERLLANEPQNSDYRSLKAQTIRFAGRNDEAIALMRGVVAAHPEDADAWLLLGILLREVGEQARAIEAYRQALAVRPGCGDAYWSLANMKTIRLTEEDVEDMQRQLARGPWVGSNRMHLEFALGKALEDKERFAESFEHYQRGNALRRGTIDYDPEETAAEVRRLKTHYTVGFFADRAGWGDQRPDPIFIVGLPRSGSTLLEQILASHSLVEGTRELTYLPALVAEMVARANPGARSNYPEPVAALGRAEVEGLAARYLTLAQAERPMGRPRFVDKMLGNSSHVGLIHLMFPQAAIIDARRHPLGCGFSCYKQLFARGVEFSYDLEEMGLYYRDYVDLMEHVDAVLPGRVHRVHYERLVDDPEGEVRRLLDYCGLPFEAGCLRFYDNARIVQTISSEQVRQPIYADAVEQWRHYEAWLGPLKAALGELIERYPVTRAAD
jgi:tetratricopeptide (TPR) repeat protein